MDEVSRRQRQPLAPEPTPGRTWLTILLDHEEMEFLKDLAKRMGFDSPGRYLQVLIGSRMLDMEGPLSQGVEKRLLRAVALTRSLSTSTPELQSEVIHLLNSVLEGS